MSTPSDLALAPAVAIPDAAAVLELLRGFLATPLGRAELARLRFHRDPAELKWLQQRVREAMAWRAGRGGFGFAALDHDPRPWLEQAPLGLEGMELVQLRGALEAAAALRENVLGEGGESLWPALTAVAAAIPECAELRVRLRRALLPSGELSDDASPELARLRRQRARQRQTIEQALARQMRTLGAEGALQDEIITVRNERFVLPVRAEQRRRAPGIVHGASSSGQTVFVEPLETVELNNENIRLRDAEQAEIIRILAELSAAVAAEAPHLEAGFAAWGVLELEAAKAAFAREYGARPAEFVSDRIQLDQARHPVLVAAVRNRPGHAVIPLSLQLGGEGPRLLVISGPNTGGKTVVLKTVGIAIWMAQCGLPVCAAQARIPVCNSIWADVGDVQSLQQNLSTFSSHLVHIRDLLAGADDASLVLLDELGTATNAAEGAALAVEVAAALVQRRAWTLITTHHDALKAWASSLPASVVNGSVALDPETFAPTYQFRLGVPGVSSGLVMAERLGLPADLVAAARARLSATERESGEYLARLRQNLAQAEERLSALQQRESAVERRERELAARDRVYLEKQTAHLRAELDRRLTGFLAAQETAWKHQLAEVLADASAAQKKKLAVAEARRKRETSAAFHQELAAALGGPAPKRVLPDPHPGDRVQLRGSSQIGRVLRRLPDDRFEVEAGRLRLQVAREDIAAVLPAAAPVSAIATPEAPLVQELNVIGLRMEEATDRLDRFLDQAILAGADQIRIVHGAGFGVLRRAVSDLLRGHPQVASFAHPPQNQGGQGVTVAVLK